MSSGFWISWYDLPQHAQAEYFSWLHGTYIPEMLKRRGVSWAAHYASVKKDATATIRRGKETLHPEAAALPRGDRYIMIIAAEHAHVFGNPSPAAIHAGLSEHGRAMLAMRSGERTNIMAEAARVDGLSAGAYPDGKPAPCIQLGNFNCPWQDEEEALAWYTQWRMPALKERPGMIRSRKLVSVAGWAKHAILYEWESVEARNREYLTHEDGHPEMKAWSDRMVKKLVHAPGSASLATRMWPPI
jgi:hypothetical protein